MITRSSHRLNPNMTWVYHQRMLCSFLIGENMGPPLMYALTTFFRLVNDTKAYHRECIMTFHVTSFPLACLDPPGLILHFWRINCDILILCVSEIFLNFYKHCKESFSRRNPVCLPVGVPQILRMVRCLRRHGSDTWGGWKFGHQNILANKMYYIITIKI